jgi:hypothetical protein
MVNILEVELAMTENYIVASWFSLGALTAEMIYAKICMTLMTRAFQFGPLIRILRWLVLIILIALAIMSFIASGSGAVQRADNPIRNDLPPFIFGFVTMAVNPGVVPFWLGWTTILFERRILKSNNDGDIGYLTGIALGSIIASALFIACGHFLLSTLFIKSQTLHFIFGCMFSILTFWYAGRLFGQKRKNAKDA